MLGSRAEKYCADLVHKAPKVWRIGRIDARCVECWARHLNCRASTAGRSPTVADDRSPDGIEHLRVRSRLLTCRVRDDLRGYVVEHLGNLVRKSLPMRLGRQQGDLVPMSALGPNVNIAVLLLACVCGVRRSECGPMRHEG